MTRFYHSLTAHYNIMYNGEVAFEKGMDAQTEGHKDDYNSLLPMYISTNKATANMGKGSYATAIEKCEKAIKLHSIKKKPEQKAGKKRTQAEKDYLARKEFNPYLWKTWMMMGESQFQRGEFIEAASTFNYIIRLYATQPEVSNLARAWMARCYVALEWPYDAEDVLRKMSKDSFNLKIQQEYDNSRAAWLIQTEQYEEAIPLLRKSISLQKNPTQKARLNFLLGQLCRQTGKREEAFEAFKKVIRSNPPYEMSLNARVMQSEMATKSQTRQMIRKLEYMAKAGKNKEFVDQIQLAIGNIHMNMSDTLRAIYAWEKGLLDSKGGTAKATLLLRLASVYWQQENYIEASRCYKECMAVLDKERDEYKDVEQRNKMLEGLAEPLGVVKLQDSLLVLARLPEKERIAVCERLAKEYIEKEKEEEKRRAASGTQSTANKAFGGNVAQNNMANMRGSGNNGSSAQSAQGWYFSNPNTVAQGKTAFFRKWGMRRNTDYWRWADKSGFAVDGTLPEALVEIMNQEQQEGMGFAVDTVEVVEDDSVQNDPRNKAFYLAQIPLTDEAVQASHQQISEALFQAGVLEKDRLGNHSLAYKTLLRFVTDYPEHEKLPDAYYHLFLVNGRLGMDKEAAYYREKIISEYPDNEYAQLLANPRYELIARGGKHLEDSLYADAYGAYLRGEYAKVQDGYLFSSENFPEGRHISRFMFVYAMSQLYSGQRDSFLVTLKTLTDKYSAEEIGKLASEIMKGVQEGRLLNGDQWDASDIWSRRFNAGADEGVQSGDTLKNDRLGNFSFVLAYPKGGINEDQLLFELARYNFTSFTMRNFELEISDLGEVSMMLVKGFLSYDEAHSYAQKLYADSHMLKVIEGIRSLIILEENLNLLGTKYSFDDYQRFYEEYFSPLEIPEELKLDNGIIIRGEDELDDSVKDVPELEDNVNNTSEDDDFPFGF
ncbi:MAG: tetratricopeptide repeat protein [Bacteroidaceae bacterium]|nr:tetratricopeptide repeat protein [Bacteroidaceae bacterium]